MFSNDRNAYRQAFFITWQKYQKKIPLDAVESELIKIILMHPEYQTLFDNPSMYENQEFNLEENPFFHMSLHMAIREQIHTSRPLGIKDIYQKLLAQFDAHQVEHNMIHCLAQMLWQGQQTGDMPNDETYLELLNKL